DDEHRRALGALGEAEVGAAAFAAIQGAEVAAEQRAYPAMRAAATKAGGKGGWQEVGVGHCGLALKRFGARRMPRPSTMLSPAGSVRERHAPGAPDIDGDEEEQPDHVDEVPVPGGELEAEVMLRREIAPVGADQADD